MRQHGKKTLATTSFLMVMAGYAALYNPAPPSTTNLAGPQASSTPEFVAEKNSANNIAPVPERITNTTDNAAENPTAAPLRSRPSENGGFQYQENGIPIGFEAWFEPQKAALDVFFGGRYLLTSLAEYTPDTITFLNPMEIAERIPDLIDKGSMAEFLSAPLATHQERACNNDNQPLCGRLSPDYAGLIFDETRFRAELFIHRDLLAAASGQDARYLPSGNRQRPTVVQNLSALHTGDDAGNDRSSLYGRTRAGNNGHYLFSDWVSTSEQDFSVDQLGYRHDLRDHLVTVGLFETSLDMLRGMNQDLLLGAGIERSLKRRTDLDSIIATPINLFLPVRGRVDIFRDGRLISSNFYEAGNQRIDTDRLPQGAYPIEIVTTDAAGNVSTEEQLFIKSTLLAPPGEAIWFAEAGQVARRSPLETMPEDLDVTLLRAGYRWRQLSWLGLGVAGAATESAALGELSANLLFDWLEAGGDIYHSSDGGWGYGGRAVTRWGNNSFSINTRRSRASDPDPADATTYRLIDNSRWLHSAQVNSRLHATGVISITSSYSGGGDLPSIRRNNVRYNHYLNLAGNNSLNLSSEIGEVDGDMRVTLGVQWRAYRHHWSHTAGMVASASDIPADTDGLTANASSRWRDGDTFKDDINAGISTQIDREGRGATADINHASEYGRGKAAISHNSRDSFTQTQYLAGFDASIVMGESLAPAFGGGPTNAEAGVILDLREAQGAVVDVYADGRRQFSARGGGRVPLTLTPYREYQISLIDRGIDMVSFDATPKHIVLYPGDVETLQWSMQRVNIIVGRLVRIQTMCSETTEECYQLLLPIADTRIEGLEGFTFTDSDGFFQGELADQKTEIRARHGNTECTIDISALPVTQGVIRAPRLICMAGESSE